MLSTYEARLCPVYRSVDNCIETLSDLEYLEDYAQKGVRGQLGPDVQRQALKAIQAAIELVNRLAAVYRDLACLDEHVPRIKFDMETGAPELNNDWDEVSLTHEVIWFLGWEAAAVKQALGNT